MTMIVNCRPARPRTRLLTALLALAAGLWGAGPSATAAAEAAPAELTREQMEFFEKQVRPLLAQHCFKCHGAEKQKGGLRVDHISTLLSGGDSGPALVPAKPEESLLIEAINYESFEMPPDAKLGAAEIETLTRWVKAGAPWPHADKPPTPATAAGKITDEDRQWWAFQPLRSPAAPAVEDQGWAKNEIDGFVYRKLAETGLQPAPEASRHVLVRRLFFDLIGLPPSPAEVQAFVEDQSPNAYELLVERLLASPEYGKRWARHWLDLVRYADSDGYRADEYRPNAWRYRDYVIRAFSDDKPYDRFVQEQLAGDELFPGDPEALTATGYLRNWIYEYNIRDARGQWKVILDDITDTTGDVFLGLGMQCARCHDHKFDPILQKDYFRLQAFFSGMLPRDDLTAATPEQQAAYDAKLAVWEAKTAELREQIAAIEAPHREKAQEEATSRFPDDVEAMMRKPVAERAPQEHQIAELAFWQVIYEWKRLEQRIKGEEKDKLLALKKQLAAFDKEKPEPLPQLLAATDLGPQAAPVLIPKKGPTPIEPGFLTLLDERPAEIKPLPDAPQTTGRRAALARWLTKPDNPLTSRVIVNRVWQYHFGRGLAANASDFGKLGGPPTHPELLDWLATQFVADGWSIKQLHRRIVCSATYRQSAEHPNLAVGRLKDPENRLYWRGSVRRLDAEQIRDSLYAATGELQLIPGGPGAAKEEPRRSIFLRVMRNTRVPFFDAFDAPFWISSAASRDVTTTPIQALLLINSQFMLQRSAAFAERLFDSAAGDQQQMIALAHQLAYGRPPSQAEAAAAEDFLNEQTARIDAERAGAAEAAFLHDKIPHRDGQAALVSAETPAQPFQMPKTAALPAGDFTIEAFIVLRSVYESGDVRVLAANWNGNENQPGWSFGVTGKQSRRKPQTLALQLIGKNQAGKLAHEPIFSDQHLQLDKPYYVAASVKLADEKTAGSIAFYVKDLANTDEPLQTAVMPHTITGEFKNALPLTIGGRAASARSRFDGLIDDVRLSNEALPADMLLIAAENAGRGTVGLWKFEPLPDVFADASGHGLSIAPASASGAAVEPRRQAWIDFCHVLLNSNEFLYVE